MKEFTPIAMRCTQEQFDAVKPKLKDIDCGSYDNNYEYLILIDGSLDQCDKYYAHAEELEIHEYWNEEIFLKACGIETETLQEKEQRLLEELEKVKKQIEEENKPKINDWVYNKEEDIIYQKSYNIFNQYEKKITNTELIKLLEQEIK